MARLRWDWDRIVAEVETGLEHGLADRAGGLDRGRWLGCRLRAGRCRGELVAPSLLVPGRADCRYGRRPPTRIGVDQLYEVTGIQIMGINTIFQLACHDRGRAAAGGAGAAPPRPHGSPPHRVRAAPSAPTPRPPALMDARTGDWARDLSGTCRWSPRSSRRSYPPGHWPGRGRASRSTSWAATTPPRRSWECPEPARARSSSRRDLGAGRASSGPTPDTSAAARQANFSNEAGAFGGIRFLKNVIGSLDSRTMPQALGWATRSSCFWRRRPRSTTQCSTFDAGDDRFLTSTDMEQEVQEAADLAPGTPRSVIVRSVLESIVAGIGDVVDELATITGREPERIAVVGGGARVPLLHALLPSAPGWPWSEGHRRRLRWATQSPRVSPLAGIRGRRSG